MCPFYTILFPAILFATEDGLDPDIELLRTGEVIVEETRRDESGGSVRIRILVQAPPEIIWNVISQCQHAYRYLDGLLDCEVLLDEAGRALTRHRIDPGILAPTLDYTFETKRQPYHHMDILLVEGNIKQVDGYWDFQPFDGGVLLEHEVHFQPKMPAPRWLVRRTLKENLPQMMLCIRGLAGGSINSDSEAQDLAACQAPAVMEDQ